MTPGLFALLGAIPWGEGGLDGWGRRGGVKEGGITIVFHCVAYVAVAEGGSVVTPPAVTRL